MIEEGMLLELYQMLEPKVLLKTGLKGVPIVQGFVKELEFLFNPLSSEGMFTPTYVCVSDRGETVNYIVKGDIGKGNNDLYLGVTFKDGDLESAVAAYDAQNVIIRREFIHLEPEDYGIDVFLGNYKCMKNEPFEAYQVGNEDIVFVFVPPTKESQQYRILKLGLEDIDGLLVVDGVIEQYGINPEDL